MEYIVKNKVELKDVDSYSFTIAKWGAVLLKGIAYPTTGGFKYKIHVDGECKYETNYLEVAIEVFNYYTK